MFNIHEKVSCSYNDVLLVPKYSEIESRSLVDTSTNVTTNQKINIPIISSNMDTVTEHEMAIQMSLLGGIGAIHRFCTIEKQVSFVDKVKRHLSLIIKKPYTCKEHDTLRDALKKMNGKSSIIVFDENKRTDNLCGILCKRDYVFEENLSKKVFDLMSHRDILCYFIYLEDKNLFRSVLTNYSSKSQYIECDNEESIKEYFKEHKLEKVPVIKRSLNGKEELFGLISSKYFENKTKNKNCSICKDNKLNVIAAIGINGDYLERAQELFNAGCKILLIDVAHGHTSMLKKAYEKIRGLFGNDADIIAGNVATYEGADYLCSMGVDGIKALVGPGSACSTRIVSGSGVPTITSIIQCRKACEKYIKHIPIIADGGIKNSGDIVKALAAGASSVMIGGLFAGTSQTPGSIIYKDGKKIKPYRGMASREAFTSKVNLLEEDLSKVDSYTPEGISTTTLFKGCVSDIVKYLHGGIKSGFTYSGAKNIEELWEKAEFVKITQGGYSESVPHFNKNK